MECCWGAKQVVLEIFWAILERPHFDVVVFLDRFAIEIPATQGWCARRLIGALVEPRVRTTTVAGSRGMTGPRPTSSILKGALGFCHFTLFPFLLYEVEAAVLRPVVAGDQGGSGACRQGQLEEGPGRISRPISVCFLLGWPCLPSTHLNHWIKIQRSRCEHHHH
jgi:hypothetical protein